MTPLDNFRAAIEARRNAHFALRTKLPGWKLYARASLRRAITKWKAYADATRERKTI